MEAINTYQEYNKKITILSRSKFLLRNMIIKGMSINRDIDQSHNWIRFPLYHHVFDDERKSFKRQLKYLKNHGQFISIDDAYLLITGNDKINGRYFCLSFDDGFYNCYSNMMGITYELDIPVIVYLPTNSIYQSFNTELTTHTLQRKKIRNTKIVPFLNWENCKEMLHKNIMFGSHTCSHARLSSLSASEIEYEMLNSKKRIEQSLNIVCEHFACPWGKVNIDFDPELCAEIAKSVGFKSVATTERGKNENGSNPFLLKRDHLLANWADYQLKYFFSK